MSRSQLKYWPILIHNLDKEFMAKIKMVMVYGDIAHKALIVLKDDSVYDVPTTYQHTNVGTISDKSYDSLCKPTRVDELSNKGIKNFAWGRAYGVAALTYKGEVYCWSRKEFEDQRTREATRPMLIGGCFYEKSVVQISCSDARLFALTKDGEVLRHYNNLTNNILESFCPTMGWIGLPKYIACSRSHVMIVSTCGEVHICGGHLSGYFKKCQDEYCQYDHAYNRSMPSESIIVKVACGYAHTLALSKNGDVYTWGKHSYGQLGIGNTSDIGVDLQHGD